MAVTPLTKDNINELIENNDILIIDFWAPWCGPCRSFKPIFEAASERHDEIAFAACNTEEEGEVAAMFQIRSIPTTVIFREKVAVFGQPGMLPAEALDDLLGKVKALDMDEVHRAVAAQQEQETAHA
jgi:thioredoxin 1